MSSGRIPRLLWSTLVASVALLLPAGALADDGIDAAWPFTQISAQPAPDGSVLTTGNFTSDGHLDVLTKSSAGLALWRGDGTGHLVPSGSISPSVNPRDTQVADLNGDGKLDIAVEEGAGSGSGFGPSCGTDPVTLSILLGDGGGHFSRSDSVSLSSCYRPEVEVGDVDGDGTQDLIARTNASTTAPYAATVSTLPTDGHGRMQARVDTRVDPPGFVFPPNGGEYRRLFSDMAAADFNLDGRADLTFDFWATQYSGPGRMVVLDGRPDGTFAERALTTPGSGGNELSVADLDADGYPDLVANGSNATEASANLSSVMNDAAGGFASPAPFPSSPGAGSAHPAIADFDGNGTLDVVAPPGPLGPPGIFLWSGHGDGTFATPVGDRTARSHTVAAGDLDEDGHPDFVASQDLALVVYRYSRIPGQPPVPGGGDGAPSLNLGATRLPHSIRQLSHGVTVSGSCAPECQVTAHLVISGVAAERLGLAASGLLDASGLWTGGETSSPGTVKLRTTKTLRRAFRKYDGPGFRLRVLVVAERGSASTTQTLTGRVSAQRRSG